jgi:hypothetical protein
MKTTNLALTISLFFASIMASASNYPGDMAIKKSCQENGPVKVCRAIQYPGFAVLDIAYSGTLTLDKDLSAYVKVNYQDGSKDILVPMHSNRARITGGCLVGIAGGCQVYGTEAMRDVLVWAQQPNDMILNALDLEIAITNGQGIWDSNLSENYHFHFSQQ